MIVRRAWALVIAGVLVSGGLLLSTMPAGTLAQRIVAGVVVVAGLSGAGVALSLYRDMVRRDREYLAGRQDQQQP